MENLVDSLGRLGPVTFAPVDEKETREVERPALFDLVDFILRVTTH